MNARERYLATAAFKQVDRTFLLGNAWVAGVTSKSVTVNGPSTPSAGSGQAGSGDAKPWTEFNKDKETRYCQKCYERTGTMRGDSRQDQQDQQDKNLGDWLQLRA